MARIKSRDVTMRYQEHRTLPDWVSAQWNTAGHPLNEHEAPLWSGEVPPPTIGARVRVKINGFGSGTVRGYFTEGCWLGVLVKFDAPPTWWVEQNPNQPPGHVFGIEIAPLGEA